MDASAPTPEGSPDPAPVRREEVAPRRDALHRFAERLSPRWMLRVVVAAFVVTAIHGAVQERGEPPPHGPMGFLVFYVPLYLAQAVWHDWLMSRSPRPDVVRTTPRIVGFVCVAAIVAIALLLNAFLLARDAPLPAWLGWTVLAGAGLLVIALPFGMHALDRYDRNRGRLGTEGRSRA